MRNVKLNAIYRTREYNDFRQNVIRNDTAVVPILMRKENVTKEKNAYTISNNGLEVTFQSTLYTRQIIFGIGFNVQLLLMYLKHKHTITNCVFMVHKKLIAQ